MSTPNPTQIVTEHGLQKWRVYTGPHTPRLQATCWCGHTVEVESPQSNVNAARRILGPHVVSKLTDAGYSIVPNVVLVELVDPDKCSFDHNGGCQAHGHFPSDGDRAWVCPVEAAKNILKAGTVDVEIVDEVVDDAR